MRGLPSQPHVARDPAPAITDAPPAAAFTPGPWAIEGRRGAGYIISAGVNSYGDGPDAYVGVLDPMFHIAGEKAAEHHANALLVAAAPDLLAALRRIADAPAWGAPERWETTPAEVRQLARAAIAKALTGQSEAMQHGNSGMDTK